MTLSSHPDYPSGPCPPCPLCRLQNFMPEQMPSSPKGLGVQARLLVLRESGVRNEQDCRQTLALPDPGLPSPQEPQAHRACSAGLSQARQVGNEYESHQPAEDGSSPTGARNIKLLSTGRQQPAQVPPPPLEGAGVRSWAPTRRSMGPRDSRPWRGLTGKPDLEPGQQRDPRH